MKTQSKRIYRKWGGVYFALFAAVLVIIFSILPGFFGTAQGGEDNQPPNTFYEGRIDKVSIYTFETSTNESCVLAHWYTNFGAISCTKKD